jgi:dihydrofolate reductase
VTDGLVAGLEQAGAAAGDRNVGIRGGANIIPQYLKAGLLDEMQIHLVPVLLGEGVRLFEDLGTERIELRRTRLIETPAATHFRFEVVK